MFQPHRSGGRPLAQAPTRRPDGPVDRAHVFRAALDALVRGDGARFPDLLTDDVVFCSPHVAVETLRTVQRVLGAPEDSLTDIEVVVRSIDEVGEKVVGEWRIDARFTGPVLYDDGLLIEPTGTAVHLSGVSVAEFRGRRIRAFRHYFDDSELIAGMPGGSDHLRWTHDR